MLLHIKSQVVVRTYSLSFKDKNRDTGRTNLKMASLFLSKKISSSVNFSVFDVIQTSGRKVTNSFNNLGNGTQNFANAKIMLTGGCCCCCTSFDLHGIIKSANTLLFDFFVSFFIYLFIYFLSFSGTVSPNRTSTKPPRLLNHQPTTYLVSP